VHKSSGLLMYYVFAFRIRVIFCSVLVAGPPSADPASAGVQDADKPEMSSVATASAKKQRLIGQEATLTETMDRLQLYPGPGSKL
jgi:hypothetical protein